MIYSITAGRTQSDQLAIFKEYLLPLNFQSCWIGEEGSWSIWLQVGYDSSTLRCGFKKVTV